MSMIPTYVRSSLIHMCDEVSSPVSRVVKEHVLAGRWDELARMRVHPSNYVSAHSYFLDACVVDFLRKCEDLPTTVDREAAAVQTFWECERQCFVANHRLDPLLLAYDIESEHRGIGHVVAHIRKFLKRVLGPAPAVVDGRFGKGATYGDRGTSVTIPHKMSAKPTITSDAIYSLVPWTATSWARACAAEDRQVLIVRGNRFTSVPKDCLKNRGICVEPSLNLFYQLGFGRLLRKRLKRQGLPLEDAQDIHRQVACDASKTGAYATIDLSNASDTICESLVRLLLPHDWYVHLNDIRSKYTEIEKGRWVLLEKFSSMGNGFTFELETLLFLAICQGAAFTEGRTLTPHKDVWVYGDDIIVPTDLAPKVITLLRYFGLTPNKDKTFVDGPFRESCGGDFFLGQAVRPYFLKELPDAPHKYIALANGIRRLGCYDHDPNLHLGLFRRSWFCVLDALPTDIRRCRGPAHLGDLVIHDEPSRWNIRVRRGIRYFSVYRPHRYRIIEWRRFPADVTLACAVYGVGQKLPQTGKDLPEKYSRAGVVPRNGVISFKIGWAPYS